jgi:clathrin heavy chain
LYIQYDEYDSAALTMIKHSTDAWDHGLFKDVIAKVANLEICYKAIEFYLETEPLRTNDLLSVLVSRVDHTRVVNLVGKLGHLAVIKAYLLNVQEVSDQVDSCLSLSLSLFV